MVVVVVVVGVVVGVSSGVAVVAVGAERGGEVEDVGVRAFELAQGRREERLGVLYVQGSRVSHWPQHHALHCTSDFETGRRRRLTEELSGMVARVIRPGYDDACASR